MPKPKLTAKQINELWDVDIKEGTIKHRFSSGTAKAGDLVTNFNLAGYIRVSKKINGKSYNWYAHHIIWVVAGNEWPKKYELIHHKDEDRANNKIDNLIMLSYSKHNFQHSNIPKDLQFINWHPVNKNWVVRMTVNHKRKHFGSYETIEDAKTARDEILQLITAEDD